MFSLNYNTYFAENIFKMIQHNINIKDYNTFNVSQEAAALFEFVQNHELEAFLNETASGFRKLLPIGYGSNLLFVNKFDGCLLKSNNDKIEVQEEKENEVYIKTGAGVEWDKFVEWCVEHGFYGLENLSLIPGTTGASPVQNIGAYGVEVKDYIYRVIAINLENGETVTFSNADCKFGYRDSIFKNELRNQFMITTVTYKLNKKSTLNLGYGSVKQEVDRLGGASLKNVRNAVINIRNSKLPDHKKIGNAGSFFKNPVIEKEKATVVQKKYPQMPVYATQDNKVKIAAGWLIDQCGFKGFTTAKGAGVHQNQALVLVNNGVENGNDILDLANEIQNTVSKKFGIQLEPEVTIL